MSLTKDKLRKKVLGFIEAQPGYLQQKQEKLWLNFEKEGFIIIYGTNEIIGIWGFGYSIDSAYDDFVKSWIRLKGFEWIEKNK